jgi:hypothetical protein
MGEGCADAATRLVKRSAELVAQTRTLAGRAFDQAEHDLLRERLSEHERDLAEYDERCGSRRAEPAR